MRKKDEPLLNLDVSDIHCGSDVAMVPTKLRLECGREIGHGSNRHQAWLYQSWLDMQKRFHTVRKGAPYVLTINGDAIEGIHHRSDEVVAAKFKEHLQIALDVLGPLAEKAAEVYIIKGTECHTGDWEEVLRRELRLPRPAANHWHYEVNGCLVDARHHMPVTSRKHLEASALSIEMANYLSNAICSDLPQPRVFLRGHRHIHGIYSDGKSMICVTGGWQFLTRHGNKVVPGSVSRPSAILLDWRNVPRGELPTPHTFIYHPPYKVLNP
jgi:hypothetical protein